MRLLQCQQDFPQMVTKVDFRVQQHMCLDAVLFPDCTPLLQEPLAKPPPDPPGLSGLPSIGWTGAAK